MAGLTKGDLARLAKIAKRMEAVTSYYPPHGVTNKVYNSHRLLRREDLPWLKRKIEKWQNTSIGGQTTGGR